MKRIEKMAAPAGTLSVTTEFNVQAIAILNPTAYTISARLGGRDVPDDVASSDLYVPGGSLVVYPTIGSDFALGFTQPQAAFQPEGMPNTATILFIGDGEVLPNFGAISLSTIDTRIVNPSITVTQDAGNVFAVDIGTQVIEANITNPTLAVSGSVDVSGSTIGAVITGSNVTLPIETDPLNPPLFQFTNTQINATIVNASLAVTQSGTWAMNASITNANIAVTQAGTWNLNATITNATLTIQPAAGSDFHVSIDAATINLPVTNPSGQWLDANSRESSEVVFHTQFGTSGIGTTLVSISIPSDVRAISFVNTANVISTLDVYGLSSTKRYLMFSDASEYFGINDTFTFPVSSLDTSIRVSFYEKTATGNIQFRLVGHKVMPPATFTEEGAILTREIWLPVSSTGWQYDFAVAANTALAQVKVFYVSTATNIRTTVSGLYISMDGGGTGDIRALVNVANASGVDVYRLADMRNSSVFKDQLFTFPAFIVEQGFRITLDRQNLDTVTRRITAYLYVTTEVL